MSSDRDQKSIGSLITDLATQLSELVRTEASLLRSEASEKANQVGAGVTEIAAGAMLLLAALLVLLQALIVALTEIGLGAGWASLLVGVVIAAIGAFLVRRGTTNMKPSELQPTRTTRQVKRDLDMARETTK